jgi:hypothetical protein
MQIVHSTGILDRVSEATKLALNAADTSCTYGVGPVLPL